ncbi:putative fad-dependent pyridine nucleotide-disulfide oxidoreductase [Rhypophila decipiens]
MATPKNIIIVGGVAGGMSCATRLRRLDEHANITVIEKGPFISYANCGLPYALGGVITDESKLNVQTAGKIESWFNVRVRINTELMSINRESKTIKIRDEQNPNTDEFTTLPYDKLVLAMGAKPVLPKIAGIDTARIFQLHTIPDLRELESFIKKTGAKRAGVIGGGFIGIEAVENLKKLGLDVTLIEFLPHVFGPIDADMAEILHTEIRKNGVNLLLNARMTKILPSTGHSCSVFFEHDPENPLIFDVALCAIGIRPRTSVVASAGIETGKFGGIKVNDCLQTNDPDIYAVGDMVETYNLVAGTNMITALAGPANRQGRLAADHICGRPVKYRGNVGATICKVFDKTLGLVGFSPSAMDKMGGGFKYEYVTVHPPNHAGYYPGAANMTMRVAFEVPTGRLLGAQIVGEEGVDKRIDVLATAMRAGMTIEDLEHLELCYAPPYNAAKDPVNMAGFVGGNVLRGDVEIVHADEFGRSNAAAGPPPQAGGEAGKKPKLRLQDYQVVDVRTPAEWNRGHLATGVNVPISELRDHIGELDKKAKTVVLCQVGYRGYLAYRILKQSGFDVHNLDGGFKIVTDGGYEDLQAKV